jgi:hypothetical protein
MNRRRFLQAAGVSLALPMLDVDAVSRNASKKIRFACFYFPNGTTTSSWEPRKVSKSGQLLSLSQGMQALEPFRNDLVIPYRIKSPRGNGHGGGTATWLSGYSYSDQKIDVGGPSVDQLIARETGRHTALSSLQLSMKGEGNFSRCIARNNVSWVKGQLPASREFEPRAVFDSMFRTRSSSLNTPSVLDLIKDQAADISRSGSKDDKRKINEYLESVRAIEKKIQFTEKQGAYLDKLTDFKRPAAGIPADYQEYMRLMLDLIVMAFYVDITRVSTFMMDHGQSNRYCDFISGIKGTWHALSHYGDISGDSEDDDGKTSWRTVDEKRAMYESVTEWHNEQFAYFLGRLKSLQTPEGSLLDNSLILYGSSLGDGNKHSDKIPVVFAGNGGGSVQTGRRLGAKDVLDLNAWHLSAMQVMGLKSERFSTAKSPLSGYLK